MEVEEVQLMDRDVMVVVGGDDGGGGLMMGLVVSPIVGVAGAVGVLALICVVGAALTVVVGFVSHLGLRSQNRILVDVLLGGEKKFIQFLK